MEESMETPMFVSASPKQHLKSIFGADIMAHRFNI